jgi:hypothetical protein
MAAPVAATKASTCSIGVMTSPAARRGPKPEGPPAILE